MGWDWACVLIDFIIIFFGWFGRIVIWPWRIRSFKTSSMLRLRVPLTVVPVLGSLFFTGSLSLLMVSQFLQARFNCLIIFLLSFTWFLTHWNSKNSGKRKANNERVHLFGWVGVNCYFLLELENVGFHFSCL